MNEENEAVIKALNMYGRVPETWELLEEIERLNNIINELEKYCIDEKEDLISGCEVCEDILKMIDKLKEKYLNVVADDDLEYVKKLQQENKQLQQQRKKQKEVIDKIFSRITLWKMEDITMETTKVLDDLLSMLKKEKIK